MTEVTERQAIDVIAEIAREHLDHRGRLEPDQRLVEELGLDSLRLLTLAAEVENRFRIRLAPEDEAAIETVGDLARRVVARLAETSREPRDGEPGA